MARPRSPSPLGVLLEQARDVTARAGGVVIDKESWRRAVGDRIAARSEPGRLRGDVLTLHVASAAWAQELSFFSQEILARVAAVGVRARSLRFQVRPIAARPEGGGKKPPPRRAELPPELKARLESVADPELRAAIAEAAALGLARAPAAARRPATPRRRKS